MMNVSIGDRVSVGFHRGTVSYVGPVDQFDGVWIGIDWDDVTRGKHDGQVNGKRYFHARSKKSGSFVRPSAVLAGRSIIEEMESKYSEALSMDEHALGTKKIELINMEKAYNKQRNLWQLRIVVLDGMRVARGPLKDCLPFKRCVELDLSGNLLSSWRVLLDILKFFPSLRYLNVRNNYMVFDVENVESERVMAPITLLVASDCRLTDAAAESLLKLFPYVKELHMDENGLNSLSLSSCGEQLECISLEGNPIRSFSNIVTLSSLSSLVSLSVVDCHLEDIIFAEDAGFKTLKSLNIRQNKLIGFGWLSELARLPSLKQLSYKHDEPVCEGLDLHELIIAKLPQLSNLEFSDISEIQRRSAEIRFLHKYGNKPVAPEHEADIKRLEELHGEQPESKPSVMSLELMNLNLKHNDKVLQRALPKSMAVRSLIGIISRLFSLDARKVILQGRCAEDGFIFNLDNPLRPLNFYPLSDNDIILIAVEN